MGDAIDFTKKANVLIEALPYIRKFEGQTIVIKYGGAAMEAGGASVERFCNDVLLLRAVGMNPVVVHGGGKEISRWLTKIGKESAFVDGLRITDKETMEVTEMVLSGKINSDIVAALNRVGGRAVGISGKDASLLVAARIKDTKQDLGFVGEIKTVNAGLLHVLTGAGYIPVISSVATSIEGETLNTNADEAAAAVASALTAAKLIFLTDVEGVMRDGKLIDFMELKDAEALVSSPVISGGMIPKLNCSIKAIKAGVESVHIINGSNLHAVLLEIFTDTGVGTMIKHQRMKRAR